MTAIQPINKNFIEDAINQPISDFTVEAGCKEGDNVAGSLKSITVTTAAGKKTHLIFKSFPAHMTDENNFVVFMKAFWRENSIYKTVFPKLSQFAEEHGMEYLPPIPEYYKGYNDDKHDYILMQDVRPDGYRMPNKLISLTLDETSLTLKELAKFHAIGYAFLRHHGNQVFKNVEGFQFLQQDAMMKAMLENQFGDILKMFFNTAASLLETRFPEGAAKMKKYLESSGKLYHTMEHLTDVEIFPTFCHFDLWSNNMLIKHNELCQPVGVKFIDFQVTQKGNIYSDLHYTLFTSTTPEFRKKHLHAVLNLYYDEFCSTLDKIKIPLPWGFTRGSFMDTFEAGIGPAFVRMTFAIPLQLGKLVVAEKKENEGGPPLPHSEETVRIMYGESQAAMDKLEGLAKEMIERKIFK